jgi:hypothetical protein
MRDICFFNDFHNGDVFSGKAWIRDIMQQVKDIQYGYAHPNNSKIVMDLNCMYLNSNTLPKDIKSNDRYPSNEYTIFINTWIGCYLAEVGKQNEEHANWPNLYHMWTLIYNKLNEINDMNLVMNPDPLAYVPSTTWSSYRTDLIDEYISKLTNVGNIRLFCNGDVRSQQSKFNDMTEVILRLARRYKDDLFICTSKNFRTSMNNIVFTEDIFNLDNDINEISYLSTNPMCRTIVGRNSGPYMFCHVRENIFNSNKQFISLSNRPSDSYPWGTTGLECYYVHCLSEDGEDVFGIIDNVFNQKYINSGEVMVVG